MAKKKNNTKGGRKKEDVDKPKSEASSQPRGPKHLTAREKTRVLDEDVKSRVSNWLKLRESKLQSHHDLCTKILLSETIVVEAIKDLNQRQLDNFANDLSKLGDGYEVNRDQPLFHFLRAYKYGVEVHLPDLNIHLSESKVFVASVERGALQKIFLQKKFNDQDFHWIKWISARLGDCLPIRWCAYHQAVESYIKDNRPKIEAELAERQLSTNATDDNSSKPSETEPILKAIFKHLETKFKISKPAVPNTSDNTSPSEDIDPSASQAVPEKSDVASGAASTAHNSTEDCATPVLDTDSSIVTVVEVEREYPSVSPDEVAFSSSNEQDENNPVEDSLQDTAEGLVQDTITEEHTERPIENSVKPTDEHTSEQIVEETSEPTQEYTQEHIAEEPIVPRDERTIEQIVVEAIDPTDQQPVEQIVKETIIPTNEHIVEQLVEAIEQTSAEDTSVRSTPDSVENIVEQLSETPLVQTIDRASNQAVGDVAEQKSEELTDHTAKGLLQRSIKNLVESLVEKHFKRQIEDTVKRVVQGLLGESVEDLQGRNLKSLAEAAVQDSTNRPLGNLFDLDTEGTSQRLDTSFTSTAVETDFDHPVAETVASHYQEEFTNNVEDTSEAVNTTFADYPLIEAFEDSIRGVNAKLIEESSRASSPNTIDNSDEGTFKGSVAESAVILTAKEVKLTSISRSPEGRLNPSNPESGLELDQNHAYLHSQIPAPQLSPPKSPSPPPPPPPSSPPAFLNSIVIMAPSVESSLPLPVLPEGWEAENNFKVIGKLSPMTLRSIEPVGPHFLAHARRARHKRTFSEDDRIQAQENVKKVEDDDSGEISEPEDPMMLSRDAKDWKNQDHYAVLGLSKYRYKATEDQIKRAHRKKVLRHHPDKKAAAGGTEDDSFFKCIQKATDVLLDPVKRRQFDSVDEHADVEPPSKREAQKGNFYKLWGAVFKAEGRFSKTQPVPKFGDEKSSRETVESFYNFWYNFDSWRSFEYQDEDVPDDNENRDQKRHMERKNNNARKKKKTEDSARLRKLLDDCSALDERIKKFRQEANAAKNKKRLDKEAADKKAAEDAKAKKEADEKAAKDAEVAAKADREQSKKAKEAAKNAVKKNKRVLKGSVKDANYFATGDAQASQIDAVLDDVDLVQGKIDPDEIAALAGKLNGLKVADEIKGIWVAEVKRLVEAGKVKESEVKVFN